MKKSNIIAVILFTLFIANCYSQSADNAVKYVDVENLHGSSIVTLKSAEEFKKLITSWKVDTLLRRIQNGETSSQNITLFFIHDSVFYLFDSANYRTIADYDMGHATGINDGLDFYYFMALNLKSLEDLEYFKYQPVLNDSDVKPFLKGGFKGSADRLKFAQISSIYSPETLAKENYDIYVKLQVLRDRNAGSRRYSGYNRIPGRSYSKPLEKGTTTWLAYREILDFSAGDLLNNRPDILNERDKRENIPVLRIPQEMISKSENASLSGMSAVGAAGITDFEIYYFSALNGIDNADDFITYCNVRFKGYLSKSDYDTAVKKGFDQASPYYDAVKRGFPDFADYSSYQEYGELYEDIKPLKDLKEKLEKLNRDFPSGFNNSGNDMRGAFIIYCLMQNKNAGTLSSESIAELCGTEYKKANFKNKKGRMENICDVLDSRIASLKSSTVHSYLEKIDAKKIGSYNPAGKVFVFN